MKIQFRFGTETYSVIESLTGYVAVHIEEDGVPVIDIRPKSNLEGAFNAVVEMKLLDTDQFIQVDKGAERRVMKHKAQGFYLLLDDQGNANDVWDQGRKKGGPWFSSLAEARRVIGKAPVAPQEKRRA